MDSFKIYDYDSIKFNFLKVFNDHLKKVSKNKIKFIGDIIKIYKFDEKNKIENIFYDLFHKESFLKVYHDFIEKKLSLVFDKNFEFQRIPSVRIAFPGDKSVNFHNDCWYGHDDKIINIWIPLTNVKKTQCLAFLDTKKNEDALEHFYREEPSLDYINEYCFKRSKFAEVDYSQFLIFPTKSLHGTVENISSEIRVSFDFRICFDSQYGHKNKNFFVSLEKIKQDKFQKIKESSSYKSLAIGYLNQKKIFNKMVISQTIQQESIISYCKKNNLNLVKLETELVGFTKPINLENILFGNKVTTTKDIVLFSEKNLDLDQKDNSLLVENALKQNYVFHFVNEGTFLNNKKCK
jgi:sporadic carbohydrate cluster 2OG-Fe(II) oxygenase